MAVGTRRIVPRQDFEGSIGSGEKRWEKGYIGNVGNSYDSVADMKADLELMEGSTVVTKGYRVIGDGGHGFYNIREKEVSDVDDGGSIIFLNNGKVAELITDGTVNVKQFGAYGDGTHDDSVAIQKAIDTGKPVHIHGGTYLTSETLNLINKNHLAYDWTSSLINYTGNDCAVLLQKSQNITLRVGQIYAYHGDAIKLLGTDNTDWVQYINIDFDWLRADSTDGACIRGEVSGSSWINEIRINNGRFISGKYGCVINRKEGTTDNTNHWNFTNVGIEGVNTGVFFNNESSIGLIIGCMLVGCRYNEIGTGQLLIKSRGSVHAISLFGADSLTYWTFDLDENANHWQMYETGNQYTYASVYNGKIYYRGEASGLCAGSTIPENTDLNNLFVPNTYCITTNAVVATLSNCPTDVAFIMHIIGLNGIINAVNPIADYHIKQEIRDLHGNIFVRKGKTTGNPASPVNWTEDWKLVSLSSHYAINPMLFRRIEATFSNYKAYDNGNMRKIFADVVFGNVIDGGGNVYLTLYNCLESTGSGWLDLGGVIYRMQRSHNNSVWVIKMDGTNAPASELVGKSGRITLDCILF